MFTDRNRRGWIPVALAGAVLLTIAAVALVAYHVHWARERHAFLTREQETWEAKGATRRYIISQEECRAPLLLRVVGERGYDCVCITVDVVSRPGFTDAERNHINEARHLFPEARVSTFYIDLEAPDGIRSVSIESSVDEMSELTAFIKNFHDGDWW